MPLASNLAGDHVLTLESLPDPGLTLLSIKALLKLCQESTV